MKKYLYAQVCVPVNRIHIVVLEWFDFNNQNVRNLCYQKYGKNIIFGEKLCNEITLHLNFLQDMDIKFYGVTNYIEERL